MFNYHWCTVQTWRSQLTILQRLENTAPCTLSDFIVWGHTWRKNWLNCAVLKGSSTGFRTVHSSRLSHTELRSSLRQSLSVPAHTTMAPSQGTVHPFLAIHSADEHRTVYSFPNTTSYCTFYASFSSVRITLWPMWLANNKRQSCFYPPYSHAQKTHRTDKKTDKPDGKPVLCQRTFSSGFSAVFYTVKLHSLA